jgi:predicted SprT family Zn-dependent metalloprotease
MEKEKLEGILKDLCRQFNQYKIPDLIITDKGGCYTIHSLTIIINPDFNKHFNAVQILLHEFAHIICYNMGQNILDRFRHNDFFWENLRDIIYYYYKNQLSYPWQFEYLDGVEYATQKGFIESFNQPSLLTRLYVKRKQIGWK